MKHKLIETGKKIMENPEFLAISPKTQAEIRLSNLNDTIGHACKIIANEYTTVADLNYWIGYRDAAIREKQFLTKLIEKL